MNYTESTKGRHWPQREKWAGTEAAECLKQIIWVLLAFNTIPWTWANSSQMVSIFRSSIPLIHLSIYTYELGTSCTALKDATTKHCSHLSIATALYIGQFNWPTRGCLRHILTILPTSAQWITIKKGFSQFHSLRVRGVYDYKASFAGVHKMTGSGHV